MLFGIGSIIVGDVEESLFRAEVSIAAGVSNRDTPSFLAKETPSLKPSDLTEALVALPYLVPLFTPAHRWTATREAEAEGLIKAFTLIDPTCVLPREFRIGEGSYLNAGCVFGASVRFGRFAFVNRSASIGHHLHAGDFVSIGPGVVIAGAVEIEDGALIGTGAMILPERRIGAHAIVGAGAVVTKDVPAHCLVVGNPALVVRRDLDGYDRKAS